MPLSRLLSFFSIPEVGGCGRRPWKAVRIAGGLQAAEELDIGRSPGSRRAVEGMLRFAKA